MADFSDSMDSACCAEFTSCSSRRTQTCRPDGPTIGRADNDDTVMNLRSDFDPKTSDAADGRERIRLAHRRDNPQMRLFPTPVSAMSLGVRQGLLYFYAAASALSSSRGSSFGGVAYADEIHSSLSRRLMGKPVHVTDEIEGLVWSLVDEQATDDGASRLAKLLLERPDARQIYVTCMQMHASLCYRPSRKPLGAPTRANGKKGPRSKPPFASRALRP